MSNASMSCTCNSCRCASCSAAERADQPSCRCCGRGCGCRPACDCRCA